MAEVKLNGLIRVMNGSTSLRTLKEMNDLITKIDNKLKRSDNYIQGYYERCTMQNNATFSFTKITGNLTETLISGSGFSFSGKDVVIGAGITRVKVTVNNKGNTGQSGVSKGLWIRHNNTDHEISYDKDGANCWHNTSCGSIILNVTQGDKITLGFFSSTTASFECLGARILVEDYTPY